MMRDRIPMHLRARTTWRTSELNGYERSQAWRGVLCVCPAHKRWRALGGKVSGEASRELAEAHMAGEQCRARRLAWFRARVRRRRWSKRR